MNAAPIDASAGSSDRPAGAAGTSTGATWLCWLLIAFGTARLFGLVWHEPLAGYANQYDMVRVSACVGLWPDRPQADQRAAHPGAPFTRYVRGEVDSASCVPSTTVALAFVAEAIDRAAHRSALKSDAGFDLREFGTLQALIFLAAALWLQRRLRPQPGHRLMHAAFFALVLADPFDSLWLNTLYTEPGALLGACLAVSALACMALETESRRSVDALFVLGLLLLGASRMQHLLLPAWLTLVAWQVRRRRGNGLMTIAVAAFVCVATFAWQLGMQRQQPSIALVNRSDALFGALLPAARDPGALATRLDLPPHCVELTNASWFRPRGHVLQEECPEAYALGQGEILMSALSEPRVLPIAATKGLVLGNVWRVPYLGEIEGGEGRQLEAGPVEIWWSLADPISRLGLDAVLMLWLTPLGAGVLATCGLLWRPRRANGEDILVSDALLSACAGVIGLDWFGAVFGDGYSEVARHLHLAQNFVLLGWLVLLVSVGSELGRTRANSARRNLRESQFLLMLGAVTLALLANVGLRQLPLGFGGLDTPAGDRVEPGRLELAGRALDPRTIASIEAVIPGGRSWPLQWHESSAVATMFPIASGKSSAEFHGEIEVGQLSSTEPTRLEIVVTNSAGIRTIVDRRWLRASGFNAATPPD